MHPEFRYGTWGKQYCYDLARKKYNKPFLVPDLHCKNVIPPLISKNMNALHTFETRLLSKDLQL